jgi:hypothetical protein
MPFRPEGKYYQHPNTINICGGASAIRYAIHSFDRAYIRAYSRINLSRSYAQSAGYSLDKRIGLWYDAHYVYSALARPGSRAYHSDSRSRCEFRHFRSRRYRRWAFEAVEDARLEYQYLREALPCWKQAAQGEG